MNVPCGYKEQNLNFQNIKNGSTQLSLWCLCFEVLRNGQIVTIAGNGIKGNDGDGQLATNARLDHPIAVVVSSSDQVYISSGKRIRKIDRNGIISTIAGMGISGYNGDDELAIHAQLAHPLELFVTEDEEVLFCDNGNNRVRKVDRNGTITTIAGDGNRRVRHDDGKLATSVSLAGPTHVLQYKNEIYISDYDNGRIRKVDRHGIISTIAGGSDLSSIPVFNGDDKLEKVKRPDTLFIVNDEIYFSDQNDHCVKKILTTGMIKIIAGTGKRGCEDGILAIHTSLFSPHEIFIDEQSQVYIADSFNNRIRKIDQHGMISTIVDKTTFRVISKSIHILDQGRNIHSHHFQLNTTILDSIGNVMVVFKKINSNVRAISFIWLNNNTSFKL